MSVRNGCVSRQRGSEDITELSGIFHQPDIMDTYRPPHPTPAEHPSLSSSLGTVTRIDHIMGHKTDLNRLKKGRGELYNVCSQTILKLE